MESKRTPVRRCIACGRRAPKGELIRLAIHQGRICIDEGSHIMSRGCYLCRNESCVDKAEKKRLAERSLKGRADEDFYEEIYVRIKGAGGSGV